MNSKRLAHLRSYAHDTAWKKLDDCRMAAPIPLAKLRHLKHGTWLITTSGRIYKLLKTHSRLTGKLMYHLMPVFDNGFEGLQTPISEYWHFSGQEFWIVQEADAKRYFECYNRSVALRPRQTVMERAEAAALHGKGAVIIKLGPDELTES